MGGEAVTPLPVVPPAVADERLSSWLARTADIYLVSPHDCAAISACVREGTIISISNPTLPIWRALRRRPALLRVHSCG